MRCGALGQGGLRIENMYWIRETGLERLNDFALDL